MSRIIKKGGKSRLLTGDGRVLSLEELQQLHELVILGSGMPYVTGSQLFKPAKWSYHRGRGSIRGTAAKYYIVFPPGKDGMKETIEKLLEKSGKRDLADLLGIRPGGYELVRLMHARPRKSRQMKSPRDISTLLDLYRLKNAAPRRPRPNAISIDVLVIARGFRGHLPAAVGNIKPRLVVLDASLRSWQVEQLEAEAHACGWPVWDIRKRGALYLTTSGPSAPCRPGGR